MNLHFTTFRPRSLFPLVIALAVLGPELPVEASPPKVDLLSLSSNVVSFRIQGDTEQELLPQRTTNMADWEDLNVIKLVNGVTNFSGPSTLDGKPVYYRFVAPYPDHWYERMIIPGPTGVPRPWGEFGSAMARSGDFLVVGQPELELENGEEGGAFLYYRDGTSWTRVRSFYRGEEYNRSFGVAVAIDGDTLVIGAPDAYYDISEGFSSQGEVFVYERTGNEWIEPTVINPASQQLRGFGDAVAVKGNTLAVARYDSYSGGSVHFYDKIEGVWTKGQVLVESSQETLNLFGRNLLFLDADTLAIATQDGANRDGVVYIYSRIEGEWERTYTINKPNSAPYPRSFGYSIAHFGDVLVVGSPNDGAGGSAYVFRMDKGVWIEEQRLFAADGENGDKFGFTVAVDKNRVVVGANQEDSVGALNNRNAEDNSFFNTGAVYVFTKNEEELWEERAFLKSPTALRLGTSLVMDERDILAGGINEVTQFIPCLPRPVVELEISVYDGIDNVIVGPLVFGFGETIPIRILNSFLYTSGNSLRLEFTGSDTFNESDCGCVTITDTFGNLPNILDVTIDPSSNMEGFTDERITYDSNSLTINAAGLSFTEETVLQVNLALE